MQRASIGNEPLQMMSAIQMCTYSSSVAMCIDVLFYLCCCIMCMLIVVLSA
jgi:hypothetical protein